MSENNNYFEVIQNRLDTLVYKIIKKEQSDEDFRITYAQILEKINTKIDLFSNTDSSEEIKKLGQEIGQLMKNRQEIIDAKFAAIKTEFDNINKLLFESLKTTEIIAAFNKIQNQIHYLTEEQNNQKASFNSVISHIENFGSLDETNTLIVNDFAILNEQNITLKDKIDALEQFNKIVEINNRKLLEEISSIIFKIKELSEQAGDNTDDIKTFIADKTDSVITKLQESDASLEILNNNLNTLIEVVSNIFEDRAFEDLKTDIAGIISKSELLSEALKSLATREELMENSSQNKEEIKKHNLQLITELESNIFSKLNVTDITDIKNYTEKIFYQGTEVLKEEIWGIKDTVNSINDLGLKKEDYEKNIQTVRDDLTDIISEESVAVAQQIKDIDDKLNNLNQDITNFISEESAESSQQIKQLAAAIETLKPEISTLVLNEQGQQIEIALQNLQTKFVTQLIQVADNISFEEQADEINDIIITSTDEIKDIISGNSAQISADINVIKANLDALQDTTGSGTDNIITELNKIDESLKANVSEEIKNLSSKLKLLTNGLKDDDEDFSYTLPDVASDLSKLKLELSNLQRTIINPDSLTEDYSIDIATRINDLKLAVQKMQESPITQQVSEVKEMFAGLTEDISSISKRTNKLIISSDEVTKKLLSNIDSFTSLITTFEKQSKAFYNSAFLKDINKKVDIITKGTESLIQSNNAVNEAFVYMGEWIDTASDSFDNIQNDITKIKKNLLSNDENITDKLEKTLNTLYQRLDEQDNKINQILTQQAESKELKALLEYVASQVSITNEKMIENEQLTQKILNMEKQLKKIEKNIAIITEYIDEDDNYEE